MSRTEIDAVNRAFEDAVRKRDMERLSALYTPDAIVMPPDAPFVKGRDSIKQFWGSAIQQLGVKEARLNTVDLEIAGDIANEVGEAILTLESGAFIGKYVVVWKKVGGQWRLHRDIWNAKSA
jgi:ketosteroid isomerase-like protein